MASQNKPSASIVAKQFIGEYYKRLRRDPTSMSGFYQEHSTVMFVVGHEAGVSVTGISDIKALIASRNSNQWTMNLESGSVDAQPSANGVVLMVTGVVTRKNEAPRPFVQSFFLAEQATQNPPSYYVLNDSMRILDAPVPGAAPEATPTLPTAQQSAQKAQNAQDPTAAPREAATAVQKTEKGAEDSTASATQATQPVATDPPAPETNTTKAEEASSQQQQPRAQEQQNTAAPAPTPTPEPKKEDGPPSSWANVVRLTTDGVPDLPPAPRATAKPKAPQPQPAAPDASVKEAGSAPAKQGPREGKDSSTRTNSNSNASSSSSSSSSSPPTPSASASSSKVLTASDVPSTAVFVKQLDPATTEDQLREVLAQFMGDASRMLVANHIAKGFAFVDLASQDAVARAVSQSRTNGVRIGNHLIVVEPSKKPVRPSGLKAMNDGRYNGGGGGGRRGSNSRDRTKSGERRDGGASSSKGKY